MAISKTGDETDGYSVRHHSDKLVVRGFAPVFECATPNDVSSVQSG